MSAEVGEAPALLLCELLCTAEVVSEAPFEFAGVESSITGKHYRQRFEVFPSPGRLLAELLLKSPGSKLDKRLVARIGGRRGFRRRVFLLLFFLYI